MLHLLTIKAENVCEDACSLSGGAGPGDMQSLRRPEAALFARVFTNVRPSVQLQLG